MVCRPGSVGGPPDAVGRSTFSLDFSLGRRKFSEWQPTTRHTAGTARATSRDTPRGAPRTSGAADPSLERQLEQLVMDTSACPLERARPREAGEIYPCFIGKTRPV